MNYTRDSYTAELRKAIRARNRRKAARVELAAKWALVIILALVAWSLAATKPVPRMDMPRWMGAVREHGWREAR